MNIALNLSEQSHVPIADILNVGTRVKQTRLAIGYSVDDLAVTCGLTSAEITRIEDGIEIDIQHLKRIAPALQTSVSSLVEGNA
jgi:transcriptional regulator with XRE-family HTH domain